MNEYKGIDYGLGKSNVDDENGIRYGVISPNSINPDALNDIYTNGEDVSFKNFMDEIKSNVIGELENAVDTLCSPTYSYPKLDLCFGDIEDQIEEQASEWYESDDDTRIVYEHDGYIIETTSLGLYVIKSPFVTECMYCSPCAPGAGDLNSPIKNGVPTYCLGKDWFDETDPTEVDAEWARKCPYPIYEAEQYLKIKAQLKEVI